MEALFLKLVNMSITASWLVFAIIAVRLVFRKTPKWILCLLWGLVAVRLICPFSIESALSLIPSAEPLPQEIIYTAKPELQSGITIIDNTVNPMLGASMTPIEPASANPTQIWSFILSQVWILGMVLMMLYTVISYLLLKRKVATAIPLGKGIKQSEFIDSPFVLGLIRPVVYLPFGMAEADMAYVIAHEKAHIRRRDHWWKPIGFLLLSVYWFNPVLWVAYVLLCRDIEAACDEKVIRDMDKDARRAYSTALLNCSIHRRSIAACPLAFGETGVKARVKSVMNYKKPAFWVILIALILSVVVVVCFMTNPEKEEEINSGYEEREAISPVTISLENVRPTGATILFHQNKDLIDGKLLCDYGYFIQKKENDTWTELYSFPGQEGQQYDIAMLHHNGVNWKNTVGNLPVGSYRLGKVIPMTSGDNPEYTTVYAEFTIDNVYTWFDNYSGNADEHSPKEHVVDIFGLEGVSLSYHRADNAIHMVSAEGDVPLISADVMIRNVFLTDLTEDGVSEVCATVQTTNGMFVEVYDAAQQKLYELPNPEGGLYLLTKKADRLCILHNNAAWVTQEYGQLSLNPGKGLEIRELEPEIQSLTKKIVCVDVQNRKHACVSTPDKLETIINLLQDLEHSVQSASREKMAAAQADSFHHVHLTLNYELGEKVVVFSKDFDLVWEYGSEEGYLVSDPKPIRDFVELATDGVLRKETAGEPFATVDAPWDWTANLHSNAVSTAEVYACLDITSAGNSSSSTTTNGILPADTLQQLIAVLNQIPKDSFADSGKTHNDYNSFAREHLEGTCSISVVDNVNQLGVVVRICKGYVEMIL
ncbi:MAG: hypothetical protein IKT45_10015, partial [Lachnospiraceae bacterium]|nr:hypothetical protein [Lachnospiraceae bacterium]